MSLESRLAELKKDLSGPGGPAISTNRNYPFAIFQYDPGEEFVARGSVGDLVDGLRLEGWTIRNVDLFAVLIEFLKAEEGGELVAALIEEEKFQFKAHKEDFRVSLKTLGNELSKHFSRPSGYPQRVLAEIRKIAAGGDAQRTVIFLSRIGALYPFYRTSALLRFLDSGVTVPTIVLYPGTRPTDHALSFMGEMDADRDYRPRIY